MEKLRGLGYRVDAATGVAGGYRLGVGAALPPLLLDDDEATAVAIALAVSAGGAVRGMEESALAALAKLDRLLPPQVRARVAAVRDTTVPLAGAGDVRADMLVTLAVASAEQERLQVDYRDHGGRRTERRLEPYRVVNTGRRWYLVARDVDGQSWRTFRVDRLEHVRLTGHRFRLDDPPDAAELVNRSVSVAPYRHTARVAVHASLEEVRRKVPPTVGVTESDGRGGVLLTTGSDIVDSIAAHLVMLDLPFEVLEPPELRDRMRMIGERLLAAHP